MKSYEEIERSLIGLKHDAINGIKETLKEKGHPEGWELPYQEKYTRIDIKYGGLVIATDRSGNEYNIENFSLDVIMPIWREVLHIY